MKKLFALLLMLGGALSSWAYGGPEGQNVNGIIFSDGQPGQGPTQIITFTAEGTGNLATWWNNLGDPEKNQFTEGNNPDKKLVVSGPMSAADFEAISGWNKFISADFSGVTLANGATASDIAKINLANAQTIILPSGLSKEDVASLKDEAKNVVAGILGETVERQITHYWFTVPGTSTPVEYPEATEGQTQVTLENYTLKANLTLAEGYPKYKYSYAGSDLEYSISETEYTSHISSDWSNNVLYDYYNLLNWK